MKKLLFLSLFFSLSVSIFSQDIPKQISYQGVLKDASGNPVSGNQVVTFNIYNDPSGGTALWSESKVVAVTNGIFCTQLGSESPINGVPFDRIHYLGVTVSGGSELSPRTLLSPTPYSFMAINVMDDAVSTPKITDGAVTLEKLADNSVTKAKILDEPGYNYNNTGDANQLHALTTTGQSFVSVSLNAPSSGFAIVFAQTDVFITHVSGTMDNVVLKLSNASGEVTLPSYGVAVVRIPSAWATAASNHIVQTVNITRVFPVNAGLNNFYLNGYRSSGASSSLLAPDITALFIPGRYGTGATPGEEIIQITGQNNFTGE